MAFKDNSSHYEVNGKRCQFKDVAKLLRKKGVDLDHNRFLILQGEVEQIALMKPIGQTENDTGMLEFLEDIIGSSRFKEPIDILKGRVGDLDEQRGEKLNRVKLVEKEKDELEKPKNEALEYLHMENDIAKMKNKGYQNYVRIETEKAEATKKKKVEFESSCKELVEKLEKISEKRTKTEDKFKEMSVELEKMNKEVEAGDDEFKKHEMTDTKLREEMVALNTKRKKAKGMSEKEKARYEDILKVPETNKEKIGECEQLKEKLDAQEAEEQKKYEKALESLSLETKEFQEQKDKLETQLVGLKKSEHDTEAQYNVAKSELDLMMSTQQKEQCKLEQLEQKFSRATGGIGDKKTRVKEHEKAIPDLNKKIAGFNADIEKYNGYYDELMKSVRSMRSNYEETRTSQAATKSHGRVIDSLMRQKQTGSIKGIFGRLGDLGAIDKKYDVAISTAAGGALDTVLVDTVDTAKKCIEYLKRNDIGRMNALALEKTTHLSDKANENAKTPENAPRLIDLIQVDNNDLKTAFYHYLRDTLVAKDMDQARRISFGAKRYRVVTLDGELIETSGAMSGGGREKMSGKMGTQIQNKKDDIDLDALERKLHEEEAKLNKVTEKKHEAELSLANAKKELTSREKELKKLKLEVAAFDQEEASLKKQIAEQKKIVKESAPDEAEVKKKQKEVDAKQKAYDAACESNRDIKESISKLNKKIKEITQSRVKSVQGKLDAVKAQLEKVKKEITRLEVGIKSAERDLKKCKDKCETYENEVTEAETKMRELKAEREAVEEKGKEIIGRLKELKQKEEEATDELQKCKEFLAKLEEEENKYKSDRIEFDQVRLH